MVKEKWSQDPNGVGQRYLPSAMFFSSHSESQHALSYTPQIKVMVHIGFFQGKMYDYQK